VCYYTATLTCANNNTSTVPLARCDSPTAITTTSVISTMSLTHTTIANDTGNAQQRIKPACKSTVRPGCDADLGGFGGLFNLASAGYAAADTILIGATDGVGTKLKIAQVQWLCLCMHACSALLLFCIVWC
jgi:hypothetical protein